MTTKLIDDASDDPKSTMSNPGPTYTHIAAAIGQVLKHDKHHVLLDEQHLRAPCHKLRDRSFGNHPETRAPMRLCTNTSGDFQKYLDEWCVEGWTAVLIGPQHVLTCAHAIERERISDHVIVFGRTKDHKSFHYEDGTIRAPRTQVRVASSLIGYVNDFAGTDWAVLKLFTKVDDITPLKVANYDQQKDSLVFGHPFGLPLTLATAFWNVPASDQPLSYALDVDNALGGSGSPVIQDGAVVGVLQGAVTSAAASISAEPPFCIDFANGPHQPQPFTPAQRFAPTLPHIFGQKS